MKLLLLVNILFFFLGAFAQHENYRDVPGLLQQLSTAASDTTRILLKCRLAEAYRSNNSDTSFMLANEALTFSKKLRFRKGEIQSLTVLSVLHREKGNLPEALDVALQAVKMSGDEHLTYEQVFATIRTAAVYLSIRDTRKAMDYLQMADDLLKKNFDSFQWTVVQYFFGVAYDQMNDLDATVRQARIIEQKWGNDTAWRIVSSRMMAGVAFKRNDLPLAIQHYRQSYQAAMSMEEFREAATTSNAMALVFRKMKRDDSAIFYAKQGLRLGEMLSYKNRILAASSLLAEIYSDKNPAEALKYYQKASAVKDSLYGIDNFLKLQAAHIREQERVAEQEAGRIAAMNRIRQWVLLGGIAVIIIIAFILYLNNRQKNKANNILNKTLSDLKATQSQLIQSEKMASLGELTAGIAHEIQNPLNFINNFSEVSMELTGELHAEVSKGNFDEVHLIATDLQNNLQKILHHGRRADSIVKNMLQHSRQSTGDKEVVDINALVDECLRLSYHGLRAKDKSFNTILETHYDPDAGNIKVVAQDIGRVLLNLFNNSFYSVMQKLKQQSDGFQPTVAVSTRRLDKEVIINVRDNGLGIPKNILDKIYQPFFTTKPAGEGTGLGLSMSYDIVAKGHGGSLKALTEEGEFAEFNISLPA